MTELDEALQNWLKSVSKIANINIEDQSKITEAGAKKYQQLLTNETKSKHYSSHNDQKYGHAADHVTFQKTDIDGQKTGVSSVGWDNHYHAMNMMRLNDGTRMYKADHFKSQLDDRKSTINEVLAAEKEEYKKIIKQAEDGD